MTDIIFHLYAVIAGISVLFTGIGLISCIFLVPPYIWYMRYKDKFIWESIGGPWFGIGLFEINNVIIFLWKKKYESSKSRSLILCSSILRVVYVKFVCIGGGVLIAMLLTSIAYPELTVWIRAFKFNGSE
jgi:hypothetical protein